MITNDYKVVLDIQLVRVVRRSELPGRLWLFGTIQKFSEHFGINSLSDLLGGVDLKRAMSKTKETLSTGIFSEMEQDLSANIKEKSEG